MLLCIFVAYVTSDVVGSPGRMYELLKEAANLHPVAGNEGGSYMTMRSEDGGYIGLIFIGAGFAAAVDSQLFQKAIAADPTATLPGYMLGGLCWFTIPFALASTFGLAAAATEHLPSFPTYPDRMTSEQVSAGMAMPFAAIALMGNGGALAVLIMAFMAVTSANFDWDLLKQLKSDRGAALDELEARGGPVIEGQPVVERMISPALHSDGETYRQGEEHESKQLDVRLKRAGLKALVMALALCLAFLILWPIPMYGSRYIFSKQFFTGWIVVVFLWAFFAAIAITCTPIWEGRKDIARFFAFAFGVNRKRGGVSVRTTTTTGEEQALEVNASSEEKK
ncbi:hypothetical protein N0V95_002042 [Ascochyta clinopodiicola]|nr:hypothetical protein N0V95_002042 [Ascochyta clinopodiicola]